LQRFSYTVIFIKRCKVLLTHVSFAADLTGLQENLAAFFLYGHFQPNAARSCCRMFPLLADLTG